MSACAEEGGAEEPRTGLGRARLCAREHAIIIVIIIVVHAARVWAVFARSQYRLMHKYMRIAHTHARTRCAQLIAGVYARPHKTRARVRDVKTVRVPVRGRAACWLKRAQHFTGAQEYCVRGARARDIYCTRSEVITHRCRRGVAVARLTSP